MQYLVIKLQDGRDDCNLKIMGMHLHSAFSMENLDVTVINDCKLIKPQYIVLQSYVKFENYRYLDLIHRLKNKIKLRMTTLQLLLFVEECVVEMLKYMSETMNLSFILIKIFLNSLLINSSFH